MLLLSGARDDSLPEHLPIAEGKSLSPSLRCAPALTDTANGGQPPVRRSASKNQPGPYSQTREEAPMILRPASTLRRGAIAPFAAFLVIVLVGMVAFAVDTGYVVLTRTELQSAADAAALAGADPLMNASVQYQMAGQNPQNAKNGYQGTILGNAMASARTQAKQFAANN